MALRARVSTIALLTEARRQGFDDVLLDPTDDEIVLAVCEMLDVDYDDVTAFEHRSICEAFDRAQYQLDPFKRKVWA